MNSTQIVCHKQGPLWAVKLNRPDKANALSIEMLETLRTCFADAARDPELRVLTITGAGDRVFSGGADLAELKRVPDGDQDRLWDDVSDLLNDLPRLTIALINGHCIGGAMTLALGCDIRLGVAAASFSYPVLKNGILPGARDAARLRELIGGGRSAAILLGAQQIDAARAYDWGLVDYVVEPAQLQALAQNLSLTALQAATEHLAASKRLCRGA
jgi:enoyl-CoA hydratase